MFLAVEGRVRMTTRCPWAATNTALAIGVLCLSAVATAAPIEVKRMSLPTAGKDTISIKMVETYEVDGVGKDTVELSGTLETRRGTPLLGAEATTQDWKTSTVVAEFTKLNLEGNSKL